MYRGENRNSRSEYHTIHKNIYFKMKKGKIERQTPNSSRKTLLFTRLRILNGQDFSENIGARY